MRSRNKLIISLAVLAVMMVAGNMFGQATRTWVSGVGDDANPCSRTAPCKTFAGAISKTASCGEIDALDPGGFGAVTITKPITIDGGGGIVASILNAGSHGVIVNLPGGDACQGTVILRNLSINGANSGLSSVRLVSSGTTNLHIEHVSMQRSQKGVDILPSTSCNVFLRDVDIRAMSVDGVSFSPIAGNAQKISAHDVRSRQSGNAGIRFTNDTSGSIDGSQFQGNLVGVQIDQTSDHIALADTVISENGANGLQVGAGTTFINGVSIYRNGTGLLNNGVVNGFGNNSIANNVVSDVTGAAVATQPHP